MDSAAYARIVTKKLGISWNQKNALLRVVLRDLGRALAGEEANGLRDEVYAALY